MTHDSTPPATRLKKAETAADFENGKILFKEYIQSLDFELTFQDVERELQEIATEYNYPAGALLLVYDGDKAIACTGIRKFDSNAAELKRMFVHPGYRGRQLGRQLLESAVEEARKLGYQSVLLDTIDNMHAAIGLYQSFGFREIEPYRFNPMKGAVYMKKDI